MEAPLTPDRGEDAPYPTCEKLAAVGDEYRTIHEFLDAMAEEGISLGHYLDIGWRDLQFLPLAEQHEITVLRFLGIDPKVLEQERRAMLAAL